MRQLVTRGLTAAAITLLAGAGALYLVYAHLRLPVARPPVAANDAGRPSPAPPITGASPETQSNPAPPPPPPIVTVPIPSVVLPVPVQASRVAAVPAVIVGSASPSVQYKQKTTYDFEDDVVEGDLVRPSGDQEAIQTIARYPSIEAPPSIPAGHDFEIDVSLTQEQIAPETQVQKGAVTAEGKLTLTLPASETSWKIDVELVAPGMEFRGANTAAIVLPRTGDSTVASFRLRAPADVSATRTQKVYARLWHEGSLLARIARDITVDPAAAGNAISRVADASEFASLSPAPNVSSAPPLRAASTVAPQAPARPVALPLSYLAPDLSVYVEHFGGSVHVTISSPALGVRTATLPSDAGLDTWLAGKYSELAARSSSRGFAVAPAQPQPAADFLRGFGRQLYTQFAPELFKNAFWELVDKLGPAFHTIQIYTDDPLVPWELMVPSRAEGTQKDFDYLGLEFDVARWHVNAADNAIRVRPAQAEPLEKVIAVVPSYDPSHALPGQQAEVDAITRFQTHQIEQGRVETVRALAQNLPQGVIHFSGHGAVQSESNATEYSILLEDGVLDLTTWEGWVKASRQHHPFFFFNACESGQSHWTVNFADGWAPELLRSGASGYIGAIWPVNDTVAAQVAVRFYQAVSEGLISENFKGQPIYVGEALRRAKAEIFNSTHNPSALAYIYYGDPHLAFVPPQ